MRQPNLRYCQWCSTAICAPQSFKTFIQACFTMKCNKVRWPPPPRPSPPVPSNLLTFSSPLRPSWGTSWPPSVCGSGCSCLWRWRPSDAWPARPSSRHWTQVTRSSQSKTRKDISDKPLTLPSALLPPSSSSSSYLSSNPAGCATTCKQALMASLNL